MPSCAAIGCSHRQKTDSVALHRFPKNPQLRKKWIAAVHRRDFIPSRTAVLCTKHFREEDVDRTSLCTIRLRENAVPTIFPGFPSKIQKVQKTIDPPRHQLTLKTANNSSLSSDVPSTPDICSTNEQLTLKSQNSAACDMSFLSAQHVQLISIDIDDENSPSMSATKECNSNSSRSDAAGPRARVVIQQCHSAKLLVKPAAENNPDIFVQINRGAIVFVCFLQGSSSETVQKLAKTVLNVRLSETDDGKLVSVLDLPGDVLIVPQATLGGRIKGTMMQYHKNIDKAVGEQLYHDFVDAVQGIFDASPATVEQGCSVHKGTYGNRQVLSVETNGPFTHVIEI